jgi:hypothetical protein
MRKLERKHCSQGCSHYVLGDGQVHTPDVQTSEAWVMLNEGVLQIRIKLVSFVVFFGVM